MSFPMVALGDIVRYRNEFIQIDDLKNYKRCRVQLHAQGIVLRDLVSGAEIKTKKQQVCRTGEFLVAEIDAKIGGFGIVPPELDGAIVSSHYFLFVIEETRLDRRFLDFFIRTPYFREQVTAQGSTNYAAIRPADVLSYKIPLPPLAEQRRIVARIEELAAKIEEARGLRKKAGEEVEALLFTKLNEFFSINGKNNLKIKKLADVCDTTSGGTPSRHRFDFFENGSIPWIKSGELKDTFIKDAEERITQQALDSSSAKIFPKGTLLVALYGANVGMTGILDIDAATNQAVCAVFPKKELLERDYLVWFFRKMRPDYLKNSFGGAQPNISQKMIRETDIAIPPLPEQRRIVAYLDVLQAKVDALRRLQAETGAELDAMLPAVLDGAFKGELK
jgi:type I restriction enzyme S subunit